MVSEPKCFPQTLNLNGLETSVGTFLKTNEAQHSLFLRFANNRNAFLFQDSPVLGFCVILKNIPKRRNCLIFPLGDRTIN